MLVGALHWCLVPLRRMNPVGCYSLLFWVSFLFGFNMNLPAGKNVMGQTVWTLSESKYVNGHEWIPTEYDDDGNVIRYGYYKPKTTWETKTSEPFMF